MDQNQMTKGVECTFIEDDKQQSVKDVLERWQKAIQSSAIPGTSAASICNEENDDDLPEDIKPLVLRIREKLRAICEEKDIDPSTLYLSDVDMKETCQLTEPLKMKFSYNFYEPSK